MHRTSVAHLNDDDRLLGNPMGRQELSGFLLVNFATGDAGVQDRRVLNAVDVEGRSVAIEGVRNALGKMQGVDVRPRSGQQFFNYRYGIAHVDVGVAARCQDATQLDEVRCQPRRATTMVNRERAANFRHIRQQLSPGATAGEDINGLVMVIRQGGHRTGKLYQVAECATAHSEDETAVEHDRHSRGLGQGMVKVLPIISEVHRRNSPCGGCRKR